jgi:polyhydroxybutyrate depolymerase
VIHFHGTDDEYTPFGGGRGAKSTSQTEYFSVEYTIRAWVEAAECPPEPEVTRLPDTSGDNLHVVRHVYGPGKDGAEVVLYVIEGGGHTWPGRPTMFGTLGRSTLAIAANDLIRDFFDRHPMP